MYTLVLLVIGLGNYGYPPQLAMTSFTVPDATACRNAASELSKQSTVSVQIHTYCVPRSN